MEAAGAQAKFEEALFAAQKRAEELGWAFGGSAWLGSAWLPALWHVGLYLALNITPGM